MLKVEQNAERATIYLPNYAPDKIASVIAIEFEGEPKVIPMPLAGKQITASSTKEGTKTSNLNDNDPKNKWQSAVGDTLAWVQVDLNTPLSINGFAIVEPWHPWDNRRQNIELQYKEGNEWKTVIATKTEGSGHTAYFKPIKAQVFRLNLKETKGEPTLNEWVLFREE